MDHDWKCICKLPVKYLCIYLAFSFLCVCVSAGVQGPLTSLQTSTAEGNGPRFGSGDTLSDFVTLVCQEAQNSYEKVLG